MKIIVKILSLITFLSCINFAIAMQQTASRKFIVITDLEPDDRIAFHVLAARIPQHELLFVGTTVMNAARKQALTRRLLDQLGFDKIPVYQGTGGAASSYEDIVSSRAAREYMGEGQNILSEAELEVLSKAAPSSSELQDQIEKALELHNNLEFVLLAPPTDLVYVLNSRPELKKHIKHIYVMGGWVEIQDSQSKISRSTYNWNMDPVSSAQLMDIKDVAMTLYSSHTIKQSFKGGSINSANFPKIIRLINKYKTKLPSLVEQEIAGLSWDTHIIEKIPFLSSIVGPYKGKQFTPADPLVIIGIVNNHLIKRTIPVDIHIDVNDKDSSRGFKVEASLFQFSNIILVEEIDTEIFEIELLKSLKLLSKATKA
jgi:hypothetical protein